MLLLVSGRSGTFVLVCAACSLLGTLLVVWLTDCCACLICFCEFLVCRYWWTNWRRRLCCRFRISRDKVCVIVGGDGGGGDRLDGLDEADAIDA